MYNQETIIFVTLSQGMKRLVRPGRYESAVVKTIYAGTPSEKTTVITPMRTITEPVYNQATKSVTLSNQFVQGALERQRKPKSYGAFKAFLRTEAGKLWQKWNKVSDEDKLKFAIQEYALSQNAEIIDYEIM